MKPMVVTHVHFVGALGTALCSVLFAIDLNQWSEIATIAAGFSTAAYTLTHWFLVYKKHRVVLLHPLTDETPDGK